MEYTRNRDEAAGSEEAMSGKRSGGGIAGILERSEVIWEEDIGMKHYVVSNWECSKEVNLQDDEKLLQSQKYEIAPVLCTLSQAQPPAYL